MRCGLRTIIHPKDTLDDFGKISRDSQSSCSPPIFAARMPVTNKLDLKSSAECAHWPCEYDRPPRNAFTPYPHAVRFGEGADACEVLGEGAVCRRKFLAGSMTPLCDRPAAEFFDAPKSP
jgi:hypothetical protein